MNMRLRIDNPRWPSPAICVEKPEYSFVLRTVQVVQDWCACPSVGRVLMQIIFEYIQTTMMITAENLCNRQTCSLNGDIQRAKHVRLRDVASLMRIETGIRRKAIVAGYHVA